MRKNENWLEDNNSKYRSRLYNEKNDVDILDWPSQSLNANLIKNV